MIGFYFSEAFKSIGRAKFSSLVTIITTAVCILFTSISILLIIISSDIDTQIKENIVINLFLDEAAADSTITDVKKILEEDSKIENVRFISKADAARSFVEESGADFREVLEDNPLPASFAIKFKSEFIEFNTIDKLVTEYQNIEGIESAVYDANITFRILQLFNSLKWVIYAISIILILLSIYLTYSTQKILMNSKLEQYKTMKLVGAKLSAIKLPLLLNGLILGMIAALICIVPFNIFIYFLKQKYVTLNFTEILNFANITILILGITLPVLGSIVSTKNITPKIERV